MTVQTYIMLASSTPHNLTSKTNLQIHFETLPTIHLVQLCLMEFNSQKLEVLHVGTSNQSRNYTVYIRALESAAEQGIQIHGFLKEVCQVGNGEEGVWHASLHSEGY